MSQNPARIKQLHRIFQKPYKKRAFKSLLGHANNQSYEDFETSGFTGLIHNITKSLPKSRRSLTLSLTHYKDFNHHPKDQTNNFFLINFIGKYQTLEDRFLTLNT